MINAFITPGLETAAGRNVLVSWMQRHVARQIALVSSIALLATFAGCQKSKTDAVSASRGEIDACTLITNEEVKAIQGSHSANRHDAGCGGAGCGSLRDKQITMPVNNSAAISSNSAMISLYCDLCCGYPKP